MKYEMRDDVRNRVMGLRNGVKGDFANAGERS